MLYDFGPRLLKLRKDKNLTQQMVVERAKGFDPNLRLSDSVLGKYESDLAVPRLTEAAALADVLNVSLRRFRVKVPPCGWAAMFSPQNLYENEWCS